MKYRIEIRKHVNGDEYKAVVDENGRERATYGMHASITLGECPDSREARRMVPCVNVWRGFELAYSDLLE